MMRMGKYYRNAPYMCCCFFHSIINLHQEKLSTKAYLLLQFWSYSFNIVYDVYTHNGGVHVHRILIFIKYLIMTGSWTYPFFYAPAMKSRKGGIHKMTGSWTSFPSYGQAGASFVSYRHTSFLKNHS